MKNFDEGLRNFLVAQCQKELDAQGKDWKWLTYLKKHKSKYEFLDGKDSQFAILEKVLRKATKKFKVYNQGEISELLSEIVSKTPPY